MDEVQDTNNLLTQLNLKNSLYSILGIRVGWFRKLITCSHRSTWNISYRLRIRVGWFLNKHNMASGDLYLESLRCTVGWVDFKFGTISIRRFVYWSLKVYSRVGWLESWGCDTRKFRDFFHTETRKSPWPYVGYFCLLLYKSAHPNIIFGRNLRQSSVGNICLL